MRHGKINKSRKRWETIAEEFDMLHDRKVIKKYGLDEGTVVLKGTIKK